MSITKINYLNEDIEKKFNEFIVNNKNFLVIIRSILNLYQGLIFTNIRCDKDNVYITFRKSDVEVSACIDKDMNIKYTYLNLVKEEYYKNDRKICYTQESKNTYLLEYSDLHNKFKISLFNHSKKIDIQNVIEKILDEEKDINGIIDILNIIIETIGVNDSCIVITSTDEKSIISYYSGFIMKYLEYKRIDDHIEKTYLQNGKFYVEKTYKEELDNDKIPFVKKIGSK